VNFLIQIRHRCLKYNLAYAGKAQVVQVYEIWPRFEDRAKNDEVKRPKRSITNNWNEFHYDLDENIDCYTSF
jgi:hypothetical protein